MSRPLTPAEAAVYAYGWAAEFDRDIQQPPSRVVADRGSAWEEWELEKAAAAHERACVFVLRFREGSAGFLEGFDVPGSTFVPVHRQAMAVPDQPQTVAEARAEVERLESWLMQIDGGDHPITDERTLREMAMRALRGDRVPE